ncbi:MAG: PHP domain-containing protein [Methylococcales bacterium]|nr:PHP domain-containing protein [Methylococcales bacterium]MBT7408924.1 PHP domain-containing protein [Methylococcales bacterium]
MVQSYDLHTHSTASDGTLTPTELVDLATEKGIEVLALTDHDTLDGYVEAKKQADNNKISLISGVEISISWNKRTIHMVALNLDVNSPDLLEGLSKAGEFRQWRAEEISRSLEKKGIHHALNGAKKYSKGNIVSRTHFARYIVELGLCKNVRNVFKHYLVNRKPGFVAGQWVDFETALRWVKQAGGVAVIAHPSRYKLTRKKLTECLGEFVECGGIGLEVLSGSHSRDENFAMAHLAKQMNLFSSCGSDYHGPTNPYLDLGRLPQFPDGCVPIWQADEWQ